MKTDLLKSVFYDDPEVLAMFQARDREELLKKINETPKSDIALILKGDKGDTPTTEELTALIEPLIPASIAGNDGYTPQKGVDYFDGKDGKAPTKRELQALIRPLIPAPVIPEVSVPINTTKIVKEELTVDEELVKNIIAIMRKLPEKERLDVSALRNANSFMFGGTRYKIEELMHGGSGTGNGSIVLSYDISSQFNGVATTFTIPTYYSVLSFTITGWPPNGNLRPTVDYTTPTSTTVALTAQVAAPVAGSTGIILYTT